MTFQKKKKITVSYDGGKIPRLGMYWVAQPAVTPSPLPSLPTFRLWTPALYFLRCSHSTCVHVHAATCRRAHARRCTHASSLHNLSAQLSRLGWGLSKLLVLVLGQDLSYSAAHAQTCRSWMRLTGASELFQAARLDRFGFKSQLYYFLAVWL